MTTECRHETVAQLAMVGTWILNEASRDVQKLYRIIEEREVYVYNITLYEPTSGEAWLLHNILTLS